MWLTSSETGWSGGILGAWFLLCSSLASPISILVAYSGNRTCWRTPLGGALLGMASMGIAGALCFFPGGLEMTCSTTARRSSMLGWYPSGISGRSWRSPKYSWINLEACSVCEVKMTDFDGWYLDWCGIVYGCVDVCLWVGMYVKYGCECQASQLCLCMLGIPCVCQLCLCMPVYVNYASVCQLCLYMSIMSFYTCVC